MSDAKRVFLAIPTYDARIHVNTVQGILLASRKFATNVACYASSLLPYAFNNLWVSAIKSKADYWAMCHADIGPPPGWLDVMIDELENNQADIMSHVVPIKSAENVYSTALAYDNSECHYRLNVADYLRLPDTFDTEQLQKVADTDGFLCVNTGLWVCRLTDAWVKKVHFQIRTNITWEGDEPHSQIIPEDWDFSQQLHRLGCKVMATKKLRVVHVGTHEWQSEPAQVRVQEDTDGQVSETLQAAYEAC